MFDPTSQPAVEAGQPSQMSAPGRDFRTRRVQQEKNPSAESAGVKPKAPAQNRKRWRETDFCVSSVCLVGERPEDPGESGGTQKNRNTFLDSAKIANF